jgi:hypothetical protein
VRYRSVFPQIFPHVINRVIVGRDFLARSVGVSSSSFDSDSGHPIRATSRALMREGDHI